MATYEKHLYAVVYPNEVLVASQLEPKEFGRSFSIGSARYYRGKVLFFEVDSDFRHSYFEIDKYLDLTVEHPDGRPKRTKFISSYRVLEHLPLETLEDLYALNVAGKVLRLERERAAEIDQTERLRFYQALNPVRLLYLSRLEPQEFATVLTESGYPKGAPTLFFTQYDVEVDDFRTRWKANPYIPTPISGVHPQKLIEILDTATVRLKMELRSIGLQELFSENSYRKVKNGFWIANHSSTAFYRLPTPEEATDRETETWWKTIA